MAKSRPETHGGFCFSEDGAGSELLKCFLLCSPNQEFPALKEAAQERNPSNKIRKLVEAEDAVRGAWRRDQKQSAAFLLFARETDVLSSSPRREASAWTKGGSHRRCSGPAGRGGRGTGSRFGGAGATGGLLLRGPRRPPGGWAVFIRPGHTTQPPRPRCPPHQSQESGRGRRTPQPGPQWFHSQV